uniref:Uncharacterized protein n=1 Tax=Peronospora matthiolae TaxID=2874970 RepID=A0AAV1URL1_9STRA
MKATFARAQKIRGNLAAVGQPKVPVPIPIGPSDKRSFIWVASRDAEIYPLVLCVGLGVSVAIFSGVRHLTSDPDVNFSRERRETPAWERYEPEEGKAFSRNHHNFANLQPNPINTFTESATHYDGTDEAVPEHR